MNNNDIAYVYVLESSRETKMKVNKTLEGWEIIPEDGDESKRLEWLIESVMSHPDQRVTNTITETASCAEGSLQG
jgi:hypothetical protein